MKKIYLLLIVLLVNYTLSHAQSSAGNGLPTFEQDADDMGLFHTNDNLKFSVFPNPAVGNFSVALGTYKGKKIAVFILDMNGRMVAYRQVEQGKNIPTVNFNVSNFSKGMYIIKVVNGTEFKTAKILVGA